MHKGTKLSDTCWYYNTSADRSSSWTGAEQFNRYIKYSISKINATITTYGSIDFGDIIQLKEDGESYHSLIVTGIVYNGSGRSDLLFCSHSDNQLNVSLASKYGSGYTKEYIKIHGSK